MSARETFRRLNAARQVVAKRMHSTARSKNETEAALSRASPGWIVATGLSVGALFGQLPMRGMLAAVGAIAGFSLRLMTTPIGSVTMAALMSKREKKNETDRTADRADSATGNDRRD